MIIIIERFSLDCRIGIGFGFGFGFTTSFGWLVYLLWFWFYDSQVKTALMIIFTVTLGTFSSDDKHVNVNYRKLENEP